MCNTGNIFILLLSLLLSLCSDIKLYTRKINFIFFSCTIYYFDPQVEKKSCATREKNLFYSSDCYPRFARASNFALAKCKIHFFPLIVQYTIFKQSNSPYSHLYNKLQCVTFSSFTKYLFKEYSKLNALYYKPKFLQ